jgi:hypothetical protein
LLDVVLDAEVVLWTLQSLLSMSSILYHIDVHNVVYVREV